MKTIDELKNSILRVFSNRLDKEFGVAISSLSSYFNQSKRNVQISIMNLYDENLINVLNHEYHNSKEWYIIRVN